jgi:hypothetical protein
MIRLIKEIKDEECAYADVQFNIPDPDISLDDLLPEIEHFLRAIGYNFKGHLTIEESEE